MARFRFPQRTLLGIVLAVMLASPAGAGSESGRRFESRAGMLAQVLELQVPLWSVLTGLWQKAGCLIDPHGACIESSPTAPNQADEGCSIDPHGTCTSGSTTGTPTQTDAGCGIDPHSGCTPG